ncbi:DUF4214 domain-containing protein [Duganella sp. FT3S]|uniref:DUF4214 domain-containing protein n=1 Tax=Rugamonas fusca TaxID=2758568 RepID=A0A7W2EMH9_9BURK|nr:DUF4214 domain-containing protein [Rugamonas fusca]MBA5608607.1 DUF4214 domain-containing protein [Rugamonas fusca]
MAVAADYTTVAQELYLAYFGRPADVVGLNNMTAAMAAGNVPTNTADFVAAYSTNSTVKTLVDSFGNSPESANLYGSGTTAAFVNAIYQNLLNRAPAVSGLLFWVNAIDSGTLTKGAAAMNILAAAVKDGGDATDLANVTNKVTVATNFTTTMSTSAADIVAYSGAVAAQAARDLLKTVVATSDLTTIQSSIDSTLATIVADSIPSVNSVLTTGIDNIVGGSGNDVITAVIDTTNTPAASTLTALDVINGGLGNDTLNLNIIKGPDAGGSVAALPSVTVSGVENLNVRSAVALTANVSTWTGLTAANVTQGTDVALTAAGTTAVNVAGTTGSVAIDGGSTQTVTTGGTTVTLGATTVATGAIAVTHTAQAANAIQIDGGTTVAVTASGATTGATTVGMGGATTDQPSGAITINTTGKAYAAADNSVTRGVIQTTGGTTVTINETATSSSAAAATDTSVVGHNVVQSAVTVNGGASTTTVSVTQSAAVDGVDAVAATVGVKQIKTVTFTAMAVNDTIEVGGLTFTAAKALTAAQAAAAFANLSAGATVGSAPAGNGIYSGTFSASYTTGAVVTTGTVVTVDATAKTAATAATALSFTDGVAVGSPSIADKTAGLTAVDAVTGVLGVTGGAVVVNGAITGTDKIATVTLDGFGASSSVTSDALTTLNLAHSNAGVTVTNTAASTLALGLNAVGDSDVTATANLGATYTALNINATGADSVVNVTAGGVTALTVAGAKAVDLTGSTLGALKTVTVTGSAGVTVDASGANVTAVNTSATTGTSAVKIDGTNATYTGGAGVDNVTLANTTVAKAIDTGAGDDSVTLSSGTHSLTANVSGGAGTDTLVMDAADAAFVTLNNSFQTKIDGFEKLSLNKAAAVATVDLANMDGISYVVSAGAATAAGANTTYASVKSLLTAGDTIAFTYNGSAKTATIGATAGATATIAEVQSAIDAQVGSGKVSAAFATNDLVLTAVGDAAHDTLTGGNYANAGGTLATLDGADTAGTAYSTAWTGGVAKLATGEKILFTYDGTQYEATVTIAGASATAGELDAAIAAAVDKATGLVTFGAGKVTATLTNAGADITFTAAAPYHTLVGGALDAVGDNVAATDTAGAAAYSVYASEVALLTKGDTIAFTYNGTVYTATVGVTAGATASAAEVQAAVDAAVGAGKVGVTFTNAGADLTLTSVDHSKTLVGGNFTDVGGTYATTAGSDAAGTDTTLTLNHMANNGTLELTGLGAGAIVTMTDATGTADTFNIVTKVGTADLNFGTVAVAGVETVNVTATDTSTTAAINTSTLSITDAAAKTIKVVGNANVSLSLDGTDVAVTSIDGSTMTGKLVAATVAGATAAATIKGGSAADTLTANHSGDVLLGGAGNDTLIVHGGLVTLTGGAGVDTFNVAFATSNVNSYATITDATSGETLVFAGTAGNAATGAEHFLASKVALASTAVFQDYANEAVHLSSAHDVSWFQFGGDTYVVENVSGGATFSNGSDIIVKLTGAVDLSTAAFSNTAHTITLG